MRRPFPPTSRYASTEVAEWTRPDGTRVAYLRRRFVPDPDSLHLVVEHPVVGGDRIDGVAAQHLEDPEQMWRICDANNALRPDELVDEVGRRLRITLPEGIGG